MRKQQPLARVINCFFTSSKSAAPLNLFVNNTLKNLDAQREVKEE